ncbi:T9SS type A sorting domain-containing protein [Flavobacterium sp.]|uniref:T9SS type A sorting domain-containing protein n=1 Tax=Flavobacterium sp. TaxID=239 RepID=UPI002FDB1AA9
MKSLLLKLEKKGILLITLLMAVNYGHAQTTQTFTTPGTSTIVIPAGVTTVTVETWGAGGGGGNSNNTTSNGGTGGGGGAYAKGIHTVTPGSTYYYTVGSKGTGGPANSTTLATAGGNSWFNATASTNSTPITNATGTLAVGGGKGNNNSTTSPNNGGTAAASLGNTTVTSGTTGNGGTSAAGGAGGAGANGGNGGTASTSDGNAGNPPGGGGGGGNDAAANKGGDGANGQIKITWTCPAYALTSATSATGPFCGSSTSVVTLSSTTLTTGTYTVTYNLSGATTATGNTASMSFTAGIPGTGTFTTPSLNIGTTTVTITNLSSGSSCSSAISLFNTANVVINGSATANAGTAISTCSTAGAVNITTGSSATNYASVTWTSNGTGTFTNANSLTTCTYTPSAADITAGNVTLTLTAFGNSPCGNTTATKTLTIVQTSTAVAGTAIAMCSVYPSVNITAGSSATNQTSIVWTSSGTGTFTNANSLTTCTYSPSTADITAGSVTLTLTATNPVCNATTTKTLTIASSATAVAGTDINMCNASGTVNITAGASATNYSAITWTSSGTGTFANANSLTACTYTPSAADNLGGGVTLTLTATGLTPCNNVTATKLITIYGPTATAGTAITTCSTAGAVNITAGSSATNYTSVTWSSSGTGTFANANSLTTCTYTPSAADISAGNVTLTLTSSQSGCSNDTSTKTLTIYATPTITATVPGSRTGTGTVIIGATPSAGTLYWYSALTGGSSLGFGTSFTTPSISSTTTFYAEAVNGSCSSTPRTGVVATVNYSAMNVTGNATAITNGSVTASTTNWTDFGSTNSTRTFTINDTGAGILSIGTISISGANASDFTVTTSPSSSVGPSSSTTFVVTFNPSAAGTRNATISIANNDTSNNPYVFAIKGTGVVQGITIQGNATTIANGAATPTTANWTDFSTVTSTRTFTITNSGNVVLTIGAISFSGTNASDFTIQTSPSATVAAYGSTTFTVLFSPSASGTRNATLSLVNNDSTKNPYTFAIKGTGSTQLISLQGNATAITHGSTTVSTTNWTDFSTVTVTRTYTIYNSGTLPLSIGAITFTGTNPTDFSVQTAPSSSIPSLGSSTFTVLFTPGATGTRSAIVNIVNGDSTKNPFTFKVQGTGVVQGISIQGNATTIANGATPAVTTNWTDFSTSTNTRTFTIFNSGNMPLTVGAITFSGTNATDFSIQTAPSATVAAFGSTTFTVLFTPGASGTRNATISIVNGDSTKNPYTYAVKGTGGTMTITVTNPNGLAITDGDTTPTQTKQTDFGSVSIDSGSVTVTYTITNTGTGAISIGTATFTGTNASDFNMSAAPSTSIIPGGTSTFQIAFNPTTKGTKTATFSIVTNATGMNPFNFDITGLGVQTYLDTDGDGVTDNKDSDDDNDGISDIQEQTDALSYPLNNLIQYTFLNETFGAGTTKGQININIPGASTTSCYEDNITTNTNSCGTNSSGVLDDGEYCVNYIVTNSNGVAADPENIHHDLAWTDQLDHTSGDVNGRMAIFNADNTAGTYFYQAIINGILPNTPTSFSFWVMNLMRQGNLGTTILPNITIEFRDITGATLIASYNTGNIGRCSASNSLDNSCGPSLSNWLNYATSVNLGNITDFMIKIRNNAPGGGGNDFAMDDILITQTYVDSDGDGIANIFDLDDENDGIADVEEAGLRSYSNGSSKLDSSTWVDANGNGVLDAIDAQIAAGTFSVADTDGDGVPNYLDLDSDNDSFFDVDEAGTLNGDGDINGDGKGDLVDTDKDGILDLYDNSTNFGTISRSYAQDTDANGVADYLQLDANNDGIKDIQTGLYSSLDANNDGKIDGSTDIDKDGILDSFDTNTAVIGSPRDLNRKLLLDFDGRNDYAEAASVLGGLPKASLMAWIDMNSAYSADGVVVGQDRFHIRVSAARKVEAYVNGNTLTYNVVLSTSQWYHVAATFDGSTLKLYLNGRLVATQANSGSIAADATKLTIGRNPNTPYDKYFKGKIDEVRIFNVALTDAQVQRMVYQEIQNTSSQVRGTIVPKDVSALPFSNLLRYYRMDAFKDDIIDDLTTTSTDTGTGMKMYNHKNIYVQQAPMPFVTERTGTFATAVNSPTNDVRGQDVMDQDWSIVQVKHNITETANNTDLAMFVDPGVTVSMTNDTKIQNDWYLQLNGKIDLVGKSQLVQTTNSDLDVTSSGSIERDQQGQSNKFNYNYWSSPVSTINSTTINHGYTVAGVMRDGTDPNNIQNLQWTSSVNGSATTPITLSSYWIFKFQNASNSYANWSSVGPNGTLLAGQGYTLKGSAAGTATQNYTFAGKPNNGTITSTVAANNLNLCGNPYASAIDASQFINDNSASITGTLYFWEHYSTNTSHNTIQYQGGYATRTLVGGTPPVAPSGVSGIGTSSKTPERFIPVGQGFFVKGSATGGTITFNNGQRLFVKEDDVTSNTMFRHINNTVASPNDPAFNNTEDAFSEEQFTKLRLGFNSTDNYHRQILLGFMNQYATAGIDPKYDAEQIEIQPSDMYFINGTSKLNINGDGYFNTANIYPLGVKTAAAGNVKFVIDGQENFNPNQEIYIYDNVTAQYNSIKSQSFEINLPAGTYEDRFSLRFVSNALGVVDNQINNGIVVSHSQADNMINIQNELQDATVKSVSLFNLLGQNVTNWTIENQNQANIQLPVSGLSTGTYIIKVITDKGEITKKILVR